MIITICLLNHISIICTCVCACMQLSLYYCSFWTVLSESCQPLLWFLLWIALSAPVLPTSALYAPVFTASSVLCILPAFALCALVFLAFLLLNIALYILPTCMYLFSSGIFSNLAFLCLASLCSSCSGVASASFSSSYQKIPPFPLVSASVHFPPIIACIRVEMLFISHLNKTLRDHGLLTQHCLKWCSLQVVNYPCCLEFTS